MSVDSLLVSRTSESAWDEKPEQQTIRKCLYSITSNDDSGILSHWTIAMYKKGGGHKRSLELIPRHGWSSDLSICWLQEGSEWSRKAGKGTSLLREDQKVCDISCLFCPWRISSLPSLSFSPPLLFFSSHALAVTLPDSCQEFLSLSSQFFVFMT